MSRASLALLLALGLPAQAPTKAPAKARPASKPSKATSKTTPKGPGANVLARVGGEAITQADFDAVIAQLPQQQQMQILMVQGGREEFIKRLAESKVLAVKAQRMGLGSTPDFALTMARMKDDLLAREYLKKEGPGLQKQMELKDEDVKAYYDVHPEQFKKPELVSVRHILVTVKATPDAKEGLSDEEAKKKIAALQAELKGGKDFAELAKAESDDPGSKPNGGLYADADPSLWVPEFAKAAKEQPVGVVGDPIKTQFGYHLMKVESRKPAHQIPFEEAKEQAKQGATRARQEQVWNQLMDTLKKEIPVEIVPPPTPAQPPRPSIQGVRTVEPAKAPSAKPEPAKPEAAKPEAPKTEATKTDAAKTDAAKTDAAKTEVVKPAPAKADEVKK